MTAGVEDHRGLGTLGQSLGNKQRGSDEQARLGFEDDVLDAEIRLVHRADDPGVERGFLGERPHHVQQRLADALLLLFPLGQGGEFPNALVALFQKCVGLAAQVVVEGIRRGVEAGPACDYVQLFLGLELQRQCHSQ